MQRAILSILLCLLVFQVSYAQKGKNREKQAKEHLQFEEFEQAIPLIEELLQNDPNSAYYNFWMGKSLYLTYRKNKALPFLDKVNSIDPEVDKEFHYYYALTLHYNLKFNQAIDEYKKDLARYEPGSTEYLWVNNRISQCVYARNLVKKREGEKVRIENLGDKINTPYSEHSPVISANDSILIFTARRPDSRGAEPEKNFYDEDIYVSYNQDGNWTEAQNIGLPVNHTGHDATVSLTADGKTLYTYRHKKAGGLFVTEFDTLGQKWSDPKALSKPFKSKYYEASICVSADGKTAYFSSDRPGGVGGRDIYVVEREDIKSDNWSDPVNLGPRVNTPFDEDAPYFHPDGKTLYYSSNGPNSMGGFDIFVTELDSAGNWLIPLNMGTPVNTPDDDIYFVMNQEGIVGYYSSGKEGGFGEKDIYSVNFPYFPFPRRFHVVELSGYVQDLTSMDTLPAIVSLINANSGEVLDSMETGPNGDPYFFVLEPDESYQVKVSSPGYMPDSEPITSPVIEDDDIFMERNLFLSKSQPVVDVVENTETPPPSFPAFMHLYFDFDEYDLRNEARQELDQIRDLLIDNPEISLEILGHTDWYGNYNYNQELSDNRAKAAWKYLKESGIEASRLSLSGFSENNPIERNESDQGRQYNRRVEFRFVKENVTLFASKKLKPGVDAPYVDRTLPKGEPGFDNGDGLASGFTGETSDADNSFQNDWANESLAENGENGENNASNSVEGISINHIYFDFDRSNLRNASVSELDKILQLMQNHPEYELEIYGHTDSYGSNSYNQRLSERRSGSALSYLTENGISSSRISTDGFSEEKPLDTNATSGGRQNNRRVEFRLVANGQTVLYSAP